MADNRMWLVHRPSGKAVMLGKRMALGWYGASGELPARLQVFYDFIEANYPNEQDDFALAMEEGKPGQPVLLDWTYADQDDTWLRNLILNAPSADG